MTENFGDEFFGGGGGLGHYWRNADVHWVAARAEDVLPLEPIWPIISTRGSENACHRGGHR